VNTQSREWLIRTKTPGVGEVIEGEYGRGKGRWTLEKGKEVKDWSRRNKLCGALISARIWEGVWGIFSRVD